MTTDSHPLAWAVAGPPIGEWRTAEGTFSNVMGAVISFLPDGTGTVMYYSGMSGDLHRALLWEQPAPGELKIYQVDADFPEPESANDWDRFRYRVQDREFDLGRGPVLVNDGVEDGWLKAAGFWTFDGPISLVERFDHG